jgi:hypothetical protein
VTWWVIDVLLKLTRRLGGASLIGDLMICTSGNTRSPRAQSIEVSEWCGSICRAATAGITGNEPVVSDMALGHAGRSLSQILVSRNDIVTTSPSLTNALVVCLSEVYVLILDQFCKTPPPDEAYIRFGTMVRNTNNQLL